MSGFKEGAWLGEGKEPLTNAYSMPGPGVGHLTPLLHFILTITYKLDLAISM